MRARLRLILAPLRPQLFTLARFAIVGVNLAHLAIHGTVLDRGLLDMPLESFDAWMLSVAAWFHE